MGAKFLEAIEVAHKIVEAASNKQAIDIILLDVQGVYSFADFVVICNGDTNRQIQAIFEEVTHALKKDGILPHHYEGTVDSGWLLVDFGNVIVHIFAPFEREYYQLDNLWSQAIPRLRIQ
ncbi:ribosome silencing factor [Chloroflexota bacterium]